MLISSSVFIANGLLDLDLSGAVLVNILCRSPAPAWERHWEKFKAEDKTNSVLVNVYGIP
jgi:hypothetical protein